MSTYEGTDMILFENYRNKVSENFTFTYFWRARNFELFITSKNFTNTKWGDYALREMQENISTPETKFQNCGF